MQYHIEKGIPVSRDEAIDKCTDERKTTKVYSYYYQYYCSFFHEVVPSWIIVSLVRMVTSSVILSLTLFGLR